MKLKKALTSILYWAIIAAAVVVTVILLQVAGKRDRLLTCSDLRVEFVDDLKLMDEEGVRKIVTERYGRFLGQRSDSVALHRIEKILDEQGPVLKSEVYMTPDQCIHVIIRERLPKLRFTDGDKSWYTDAEGKVFPVQGAFEGEIPIALGRPHSGVAGWIDGVLEVASFMEKSAGRGIPFASMEVSPDGEICLKAADGRERILLGYPSDCGRKFRKVERFYHDIRGGKGEGYYSTVDVRYKGQIICRK